MSAMSSYLWRHTKTNKWFARKRIPDDLRNLYSTGHVYRPLGTSKMKEANRLKPAKLAEIEAEFEQKRQDRDLPPEDRALAEEWFAKNYKDGDEFVLSIDASFVAKWLNDDGHALPGTKRLGNVVRHVSHLYERKAPPKPRLVIEDTEDTSEPARDRRRLRPIGRDNPSMMAMLERWINAQTRNTKTAEEWAKGVKRFTELHGDVGVRDVRKSDIREYMDALRMLPESRLVPKELRERLAGKSLPEMVEIMREDRYGDVQRLLPPTVNRCITAVSSVLGQAVKDGYIDANPAYGIKVRESEEERAKRAIKLYDETDLETIFESPKVSQWDRPATERDQWFWLPRLAYYLGCRIEEIGQAWVDDIRQSNGVWYLDINADGTPEHPKRLKNAASIRKVPLRREILTAGFLEYHAAMKKSSSVRLFPQLKNGSGKYPNTKGFASDWSEYMHHKRHIGAHKVFHSFRHGFQHYCEETGLPEYIALKLMGHKGKDVHGRVYTKPLKIETLAEHLNRVTFPKLVNSRDLKEAK
jgi:hypothetical protein